MTLAKKGITQLGTETQAVVREGGSHLGQSFLMIVFIALAAGISYAALCIAFFWWCESLLSAPGAMGATGLLSGVIGGVAFLVWHRSKV